MQLTRREFMDVAASATAGIALSSRPGTVLALQSSIRVRKDVATLTDMSPEIVALKKAIPQMKALPAGDRRNWVAQSKLHGSLTGGFGGCQHGNWFFLPWHRVYLYCFEEIIRELSGDANFALPYWNWSKDHKLPGLFWGSGNTLDNPRPNPPGAGRKQGLGPMSKFSPSEISQYVGPARIGQILSNPDFETFGGAKATKLGEKAAQGELESGPHNFLHRWVGGDMVTGGSPYDPIFWLHHANVDRIWTEWVRRHPNDTPSDSKWLGTTFPDMCELAGQKISIRATLDTRNLFYRYDQPETPIVANPTADPVVITFIESGGAKFENNAASFPLFPTDEQKTRMNAALKGVVNGAREIIRLRLFDVKVPGNQDVSLEVFVNNEKLSLTTPFTDPSYVGSFTFFGHGEHHGGGTTSLLLNPAIAFRRLKADGFNRVSLLAKPLFPETEGAWKGEVQELSPKQVGFEIVRLNAARV